MDKKASWALAAAGWVLAIGLLVIAWRLTERLGNISQAGQAAPSGHVLAANKALCPVCQETVEINDQTPRVIYKNQTYYFCEHTENGRSHKTLFLMNPEKYLGGGPALPDIKTGMAPLAQRASPEPNASSVTAGSVAAGKLP